jgi:hypothetical protein
MIRRLPLAAGSCLVAALWVGSLCAADPHAQPEGGAAVVVLQNGSALVGRVEETPDRLIVSSGPASMVRIPIADVDFVAPDWATAYHTQRARLDRTDVRRHLQLAQWCLRHNLEALAAEELLHLVRLDPHEPAVKALERELRRRAGTAAAEPASPGLTSETPVPTGTVVEPWGTSPTGEDRPPVAAEALAEFTRTVQPLLLNRCGQTTCHGRAGESRFHLQRLTASGSERRMLTLRNMRSVITQLDATGSPASPLLEQAVRPHGRSPLAPLGPQDSRQVDRLRDWVSWVVTGERVDSNQQEDSLLPDGSLKPADIFARPEPLPASAARSLASSPPAQWEATDTADAANRGEQTVPPEHARAAAADPYDPAAFNARFSSGPLEGEVDR